MTLPKNLFALAFRQEKLGLMLALLLGIMAFLGSMAMAAQAGLARTASVWTHDLRGKITIEVGALPDETAEKREERAQKAVAILMERPGVAEVKLLPETETRRLLTPWVTDAALLESLALPRLIDVDLAGTAAAAPQPDRFLENLKPLGGDFRAYRHEQGLMELSGFLRGLGALAWGMLGLTGVALVAIVWVICRAALSLQRETIELLHIIGATDAVIVTAFQAYVRRLAAPAAAVGFVLAALTVGGLLFLIGTLGGLSLVAPVSWVTVGGMMAFVPVATMFLAVVTARFSVHGYLRRLV